MSKLDFSHCNIAMATHESTGRTIVWDRDTDTFGSGFDLPEALKDLADNYGDEYRYGIHVDFNKDQLSEQDKKSLKEELENWFND